MASARGEVAAVIETGQSDAETRLRDHIKRLLKERGIVQHRFGEAAGRGPAWVSAYLRGKRRFPLEKIDDVAGFFGMSTGALLAGLNGSGNSDDARRRGHSQSRSQLARVVKFPSQPRRRRLVCRLWLRPPHWTYERIEVPHDPPPPMPVNPDEYLGVGPNDYAPELAREFKASFQTAWETGQTFEVYYISSANGIRHWRLGVFQRQGQYLMNEVYVVPPLAGAHSPVTSFSHESSAADPFVENQQIADT